MKSQFVLSTLAAALALAVTGIWVFTPSKVRFIYLFGFDMERPLPEGSTRRTDLTAALDDLAGTGIVGIVHASLGHNEDVYRTSQGEKGVPSEDEHNSTVYTLAHERDIPLWLAVRVTNTTSTNGTLATYTDTVNSSAPLYPFFTTTFDSSIAAYAGPQALYHSACTVLLFEDDTPYHRRDGGGRFWLEDMWPNDDDGTPTQRMLDPAEKYDRRYVERFPRLYTSLVERIRAVNPSCRIGLHTSSYNLTRTLDGTPLITRILADIPRAAHPDFVLFDSYVKRYTTQKEHESSFLKRVEKFRAALPPYIKLYTTAQIHTSNMVGYGLGRTPSLEQLLENLRYLRTSGVDGFGYLGKDHDASHTTLEDEPATPTEAAHTHCTHIYAFDPRMEHAKMGHEMMGYLLPDGSYKSENHHCSYEEDSNPFAPNANTQRLLWVPDSLSGLTRWKKAIELLSTY